jgi:hypothetical protein
MNAVLSGQAGIALLLDGEKLSSLRADRPGEVIHRSPGEVPLLFGDAKDLQFLEAVGLEEVSSRLGQARDEVDALHLALILLDESLSHDTRRTAADELEEMLTVEGNQRFVENVLHAHPLPRGSDLIGARSLCPGYAERVRHLLEKLGFLQGVIAEVHFAWEQIPENLFDGKRDRAYVRSSAVREGMFCDLVALRAGKGSIDSFLKTAYLNVQFRRISSHREILQAWLSPLRLDEMVQPRTVEADYQHATVVDEVREVSRQQSIRKAKPPLAIDPAATSRAAALAGVTDPGTQSRLSQADIILLPSVTAEPPKGPAFASHTREIFRFLKSATLSVPVSVEVATETNEVALLVLHGELLDLGVFLVTYAGAPLLLRMLANYLSGRLREAPGRRESRVRCRILIENRDGSCSALNYDGPADTFEELMRAGMRKLFGAAYND